MIIQSADTITGLSDIDLCDLVVVRFADKIINTGAIDAGQLLCLREQWTRYDIGSHGGQVAADRTDTIRLPIVVMISSFLLMAISTFSLSLLKSHRAFSWSNASPINRSV